MAVVTSGSAAAPGAGGAGAGGAGAGGAGAGGAGAGGAGAGAALLAAAAALRVALGGFDAGIFSGADCAQITAELAATEKACQTVRLLAAARAVSAGVHRQAGYRDGASWLARQSGTTGRQAQRELVTAGRLEDCPSTRDALLAGDISLAQAAEITEAESDTPGVEQTLVEVARGADLTRLRDRAREERLAGVAAEQLHQKQRRARSFRHWRDRLGMVCFAGQLPPEVGVPLITRLERATEKVRRAARSAAPEAPPERWEAHAADAFVEMCAPSGDSGKAPPTELVVVCDLYAWRRGHAHPGEPCHIIGGGPIPVALAQELGRDAFLKVVLHDGTAIHTVKHVGRYCPVELRTALDLGPVPEFTGRQCAECGVRWGLQYDHIDPIENDGVTSYDNIQALCWADHHDKTERDRQAGLIGNRRRDRPPPPGPPPPAGPAPPQLPFDRGDGA